MKALTLHQPWASLIALRAKTIETRSWSTSYRGPLAIHGGLHYVPFNCGDDNLPTPWVSGSQMVWRRDDPAFANGNPFHRVHLGAVVATCTLVDVLPMVAYPDERHGEESVVVHGDETLDQWIPDDATWTDGPSGLIRDISDQLPYGDFRPGRWAWMLADVVLLDEPVPARGHQGLWEWAG